MKNIVVLATGGTIAGISNQFSPAGYLAGQIHISQILNSIPNINSLANIHAVQFSNIDSKDISEIFLLNLANKVNQFLNDSLVDGIVITHGTDSIEESAFFIHLTSNSSKPVIFTGAMRPATSFSPDGPENLFDAVSVAADDTASGVLVVFNKFILSPIFISKHHTTAVNAFDSDNPAGFIFNHKPNFYFQPVKNFSFDIPKNLPAVKIIYAHANDDGLFIRAAVNSNVKGIVYAGFGNGSISKIVEDELNFAAKNNIIIIRSSRVNSGAVFSNDTNFIDSGFLNPQKARILLQLALTKTNDREKIREIFKSVNMFSIS